jgi:hypothetical protein
MLASPYARTILFALQRTGKHVYTGTVAPAEKARRRKADKAARKARRIGRAA